MGGTKKYPNLLYGTRVAHAIWRESSGKYALPLHSCISVTDRVKFNEQNNSIAVGPLYVYTKFEAISEDVAVLNPMGIGPRNVGTVLVQDRKIYFI